MNCLRKFKSSSRSLHLTTKNAVAARNGDKATKTVDVSEVQRFNKEINWWEKDSGRRLLRSYNDIRIPFILKSLINIGKLDAAAKSRSKPLLGLKILDVGCGGGFATEALASLGAETTGVDAAENLISVAKEHMKSLDLPIKPTYITSTIEDYAINNQNKFDVVFSSEVIEHVSNSEEFVNQCVACAKPGGSMVITTINRNIFTRVYMLWFNEYLTGIIPLRTHVYKKFITPNELITMLKTNNCITKGIEGHTFNPISEKWFIIPTTKLNYGIHAVKSSNKYQ